MIIRVSIYKPRGVALAPLSARPSSSRRPCTTSSSSSPPSSFVRIFQPSLPLFLSPLRGGGLSPSLFSPSSAANWEDDRAQRTLSREKRFLYLHACHGLPSSREEGRGREGGRGREKDSRLEIRSIGLIGLRRHGLAARAPPIARTQHGRRI